MGGVMDRREPTPGVILDHAAQSGLTHAPGESVSRHPAAVRRDYYVIAVKTGGEQRYIKSAENLMSERDGRFVWPRRALSIRKEGVTSESIAPLYPGYLFWETRELSDRSIMALRRGIGFVKFLRSNYDITPLCRREHELFSELIAYGEVIKKSSVVFDESNRIRVIDGPLRRLEGSIVKVDRRKGRAKVALSFHGRTIVADLGFEVLENADRCEMAM